MKNILKSIGTGIGFIIVGATTIGAILCGIHWLGRGVSAILPRPVYGDPLPPIGVGFMTLIALIVFGAIGACVIGGIKSTRTYRRWERERAEKAYEKARIERK